MNEPVFKPIPPCRMPCPKCGGDDANRKYRKPGEIELSYEDRGLVELNCFVEINGWLRAVCIMEHIEHYCRTCKYTWRTDVLNKNSFLWTLTKQ
jgi:hypothetical protein